MSHTDITGNFRNPWISIYQGNGASISEREPTFCLLSVAALGVLFLSPNSEMGSNWMLMTIWARCCWSEMIKIFERSVSLKQSEGMLLMHVAARCPSRLLVLKTASRRAGHPTVSGFYRILFCSLTRIFQVFLSGSVRFSILSNFLCSEEVIGTGHSKSWNEMGWEKWFLRRMLWNFFVNTYRTPKSNGYIRFFLKR